MMLGVCRRSAIGQILSMIILEKYPRITDEITLYKGAIFRVVGQNGSFFDAESLFGLSVRRLCTLGMNWI